MMSPHFSNHSEVRAIASEIIPIPLPEDPAVHNKYATPSKHRRRREDDFVIQSPDPQSSEIPTAKFQRFYTVGAHHDYGRSPTLPLAQDTN